MQVTHEMSLTKEYILSKLNEKGLLYDVDLQTDEDEGGYCYSVTTEFASGLFSDHTNNGMTMFIFDNNMYNWAKGEGFNDNQMDGIKLYKSVNDVDEFIGYLSTEKMPRISRLGLQ